MSKTDAYHVDARPDALPFEQSLAGLIDRIGADVETWDRAFVRRLAGALAEVRENLWLEPLERLGLRDVILNFRAEETLTVVVTGHVPGVAGALTWQLRESELRKVPAEIRSEPQPFGLSVCSLDASVRGRGAELLRAAGPLPAGQRVVVRAFVTVDGEASYRVSGLGLAASVPPEDLQLDEGDA
ncbi:MAG: hypothetical protein RIT45_517 [Pseudomonadota bacterium]|jgi:hypothetical protein